MEALRIAISALAAAAGITAVCTANFTACTELMQAVKTNQAFIFFLIAYVAVHK